MIPKTSASIFTQKDIDKMEQEKDKPKALYLYLAVLGTYWSELMVGFSIFIMPWLIFLAARAFESVAVSWILVLQTIVFGIVGLFVTANKRKW